MTTTTRVPYRKVDVLALRIDPKRTCDVVEDQPDGATHVKVRWFGKTIEEYIRNEDVMPLGQRPIEEVI